MSAHVLSRRLVNKNTLGYRENVKFISTALNKITKHKTDTSSNPSLPPQMKLTVLKSGWMGRASVVLHSPAGSLLFNIPEKMENALSVLGKHCQMNSFDAYFFTCKQWKNFSGSRGMFYLNVQTFNPSGHFHGPANIGSRIPGLFGAHSHTIFHNAEVGKQFSNGYVTVEYVPFYPCGLMQKRVDDSSDQFHYLKPDRDGHYVLCFPRYKMKSLTTEKEIRGYFSPFGHVHSISVIPSLIFVRFKERESAVAALDRYVSRLDLKATDECRNEPPPRKNPEIDDNDYGASIAYVIKLRNDNKRSQTDIKVDVELISCLIKDNLTRSQISQLLTGKEVKLKDKSGHVENKELKDYRDEEGYPTNPIIILECPNEYYIQELLSSRKLQEYQRQNDKDMCVSLVVHMTPEDVIQNPEYQKFINGFQKSTIHWILNEKSDGELLDGLQNILPETLSHINSEVFHVSASMKKSLNKLLSLESQDSKTFTKDNIMYPPQGYTYVFTNRLGMHTDLTYIEETRQLAKKLLSEWTRNGGEIMKMIKQTLKKLPINYYKKDEQPCITFLGTGSSTASRHRGQCANLLYIGDDNYILLDCGGSALEQIYNLFGNQADDILLKIKVIFISHSHTDHNSGLPAIIERRIQLFRQRNIWLPKVTLICPWFMQRYRGLFAFMIPDYEAHVRHYFTEEEYQNVKIDFHLFKRKLKLKEVKPVQVDHDKNRAYGIVIEHMDGWKLVYSGDTAPCEALIQEGKDCDILIHEGTFCDKLQGVAAVAHHSTVSQAIETGKKMNAKNIILTHFSVRYFLPTFSYEHSANPNVTIAFDGMRVRRKDLRWTPLLNAVYKNIFIMETFYSLRKRSNEYERSRKILSKF